MIKALFIGRFQPFHLGHLDAIEQISTDCDKIIIAIGSSQISETKNNPYDFEKRKNLIENVLNNFDYDYEIISLEDKEKNSDWLNQIKEIDFDIAYSSNELVKNLLSEAGYKVKPISFNIDITATQIRYMKERDDKNWKKFIHKSIIKLL